jgi:hypothetical protein
MASNLPTLGAVQVRNEKGELVMQKVKVKRYIPGKKPDYAPDRSESELVWFCFLNFASFSSYCRIVLH